jgi:hypothetical protein
VKDPLVGSERFSAVWTNPFYASLKNKIIILNFKNIHHTEIHLAGSRKVLIWENVYAS